MPLVPSLHMLAYAIGTQGGTPPLWHMPAYAIGPFLAYACICLHMPLGPGPHGPPPQGGGGTHPCGICQHMPAYTSTALVKICSDMLAYAMAIVLSSLLFVLLGGWHMQAYARIYHAWCGWHMPAYAGICWHLFIFSKYVGFALTHEGFAPGGFFSFGSILTLAYASIC